PTSGDRPLAGARGPPAPATASRAPLTRLGIRRRRVVAAPAARPPRPAATGRAPRSAAGEVPASRSPGASRSPVARDALRRRHRLPVRAAPRPPPPTATGRGPRHGPRPARRPPVRRRPLRLTCGRPPLRAPPGDDCVGVGRSDREHRAGRDADVLRDPPVDLSHRGAYLRLVPQVADRLRQGGEL